MNWKEESKTKTKTSSQMPLLFSLSNEEQQIVAAFDQKNQLHVDEICYATNFPISKTSSYLLQLEFSNVVKSLPGKMYQLNH